MAAARRRTTLPPIDRSLLPTVAFDALAIATERQMSALLTKAPVPAPPESLRDAIARVSKRGDSASLAFELADKRRSEVEVSASSVAVLSAPDLEQALTRASLLMRAIDPNASTTFSIESGICVLLMVRKDERIPRMIGYFTLSRYRDLLVAVDPTMLDHVRYRIPYPRPPDAAILFERLGPRIDFDAASFGFELPARFARAPMPHADAHTSAMFFAREADAREQLTTEISRALDSMLDARRQLLPSVAARLNLSPRTLQRRMDECGLEFATLVDARRQHRALSLMQRPELTIAQIAQSVGYVDLRAFRSAFRRWTGETPRTARRGLRAPA